MIKYRPPIPFQDGIRMMDIRVVLVNPKYEGNIGAVARSMANFGLHELVMVGPCEIGDDAYRRAKHGSEILDDARIVETFPESLQDCYLVVGTSGIISEKDKNYVRLPISPRELGERIHGCDGKVALLFGREDVGLFQEELKRCDVLVSIPAHPDYPILNISHAATVLMYEIFQHRRAGHRPSAADEDETGLMYEFFDDLLDAVGYPPHRRENTSIMFRRMIGRSVPSKWEFRTIMGVLADAAKLSRQNDRRQ